MNHHKLLLKNLRSFCICGYESIRRLSQKRTEQKCDKKKKLGCDLPVLSSLLKLPIHDVLMTSFTKNMGHTWIKRAHKRTTLSLSLSVFKTK